MDVPVLGRLEQVTAEVLDRNGQILQLAVEAARHDDTEPSLHWATAELALAPLAPGDYVMRMAVQQGSKRHESLTAFKVVP